MGIFSFFKNLFAPKHSLVAGLALGSGGAKGMAHLGVLKAFEEEGLSFSVAAGASIGSIVAALYAKGYTSRDMAGIVESLNRKEFAKNLRPFSDLAFAEEFLSDYLDGDIEQLPKPFAAVATDGETNESVVLRTGNLARALTASAAIPPFFRGVEIGGRKLYDGAFSNAVPSEICRELGADFVVGVDLSAFLRQEEEQGRIRRLLGNAVSAMTPVRYREDCRTRGYEHADVMLRPDLREYDATDVSPAAMESMMEIGYREAKSRIGEIKAAMKAKSHE